MRSALLLDEVTTRARIRDASIDLFGANGFAHTSIRAIAEQVGVSPALVIHHFSSKSGLREACDDHIVNTLIAQKSGLHGDGLTQTIGTWLADIDLHRPLVDYLGRMLLDGTAAGDHLFDQLVAETRSMIEAGIADGAMNASSDTEVLSLVVALYGIAPLVMRAQLDRRLGSDLLDASTYRRIALPILELYTHGLYRDDSVLRATRQALAATRTGATDEQGGNLPKHDPDPPATGTSP